MAMTLAEKIVARAAGREHVTPGEIVTCAVDLAMIHDSGGPRRVAPILKRFGVGLWDPSKVVLISDHYVPAGDDETRRIGEVTRQFAAENKLAGFYDSEGICHVVLPERGHLKPGMFVVGGDSHSPTGGAFGAYMFGIGATEMAGVLATGEIWLTVPETIEIEWRGTVRTVRGRQGRDAVPVRPARHGRRPHPGRALPRRSDPRAADAGAHDARQHDRRTRRTDRPAAIRTKRRRRSSAPPAPSPAISRAGSRTPMRRRPNAIASMPSALTPQVAAPHSPANAAPVADHGAVKIDVAHIGACTGAKLVDLRMAASVLKGRKVDPGVSLLVAPASRRDQEAAANDGTLQILVDAGATLLPNACGMCAGYNGTLAGKRDLHLLDRAQLQGPHGNARARTSISARPTRWRLPPCAAASPIRASCCHDRHAMGAPSSTATASTPTCWRPASI